MPRFLYAPQLSMWGTREIVGFGSHSWCVRQIPRTDANDVIRREHYSGKVFVTSYLHLGVFIGQSRVGVLQFGPAMNSASGPSILPGVEASQWCELNRMWLSDDAPRNSESRAISYGIKVLRARRRGIRFVQSCADERCGGLGIVYQASSFGFYGAHTAEFWELDGELYHNIEMTRKRRGERSYKVSGAVYLQANRDRATRHSLRQFRYLRFFGRRWERECLLERLPYPKHYADTAQAV